MIRLYRSPSFINLLYPSLIWKIHSQDSIFLTFDDGPDSLVTPWVLDALRSFGAKASFFCLGKNIEQQPGLARQIISEGHLLANHTYSHLSGAKTEDAAYLKDIEACDVELSKLGIHTRFFRPPYGRIKRSQIAKLKNKKIVMWNRLSWDFDPQTNLKRSVKFMKQSPPGSILVFHDNKIAFDHLKVLLPEVLNHFKNKGLKLASLDD